MPGKTRSFSCNHCAVDFAIEVEPGYPLGVVEAEFPATLNWLERVCDCPVCGNQLEER